MQRQQRRLAAILAADVYGYSRMMGADETSTLKALTDCRALFSKHVDESGGRIVNAPGDSILADFGSVIDAVNCALDIQRCLETRNHTLPEAQRMYFRIGVNLGDVLFDEAGIYGDGVNVAARLESIAEPGGICISDRVFEQCEGRIAAQFQDLGARRLKNIDRPVRAWRWVPGDAAGRPKPQTPPAQRERMAHALPDRPSIAVLPFLTIGAGASKEFFADGLTEDIITELSRFRDLFVIARNSTFVYKGRAVKVQQVAEELGVRYVLEGSVQWAGDAMRITAQLVDALSGAHVWAEKYDRSVADAFGVRDEVTADIVAHLSGYHGELVKAEKRRSHKVDTNSMAAYEGYLRGIELKHRFTKETNLEARALLERVTTIDAQFARAYLAQAWTWLFDVWWGWGEDPGASLARARELAEKAAVLDDLDAEVHWLLAEICFIYGEYERTVTEYGRALELNPNLADVYANWGLTQCRLGEPEQGVRDLQRAMRLNPNHPDWYTQFLGCAQYLARQYDEAIRTLRRVKNHSPNTRLYLAASHARLAELDEARAQVAEAQKIALGITWERFARSEIFRREGDRRHLAEGVLLAGLAER
jgi:adenylate cyclase